MFLERLDAPELAKPYYLPNGNINDMPNCTKYYVGRAHEAVEDPTIILFKGRGAFGFPEADNMINDSLLETGEQIKLGAGAVFSSEGGTMHVIFIERVNPDGTCLISDSRFDADKTLRNKRFFRTVDNVVLKINQTPGGIEGVGNLIGFIYNKINDIRVERDPSRYQIEVIADRLQCRSSYGKSAAVVNKGCYVPKGIYNIIETKEADGYLWCKVEEGHWFAYSSAWANLFKPEGEIPVVIDDDLIVELEASLNRFKDAYAKVKEESDKYKKIKEIIDG